MTRRDRTTTPVLPPRKCDWKPGDHQIGLFLRMPNGSVIELSVRRAKPGEAAAAIALLKLLAAKDCDRK